MATAAIGLARLLGGRVGPRAAKKGLWFTAAPWAYLAATLSWLVLMARQVPCLISWDNAYTAMCYTDITPLYHSRGLAQGQIPFLDSNLEYPVLTGAFMELGRRLIVLVGGVSAPGVTGEQASYAAGAFFGVTAFLLFVLFLVLIRVHLSLSRPWDALMVAASPTVMATGVINWDMLVLALTGLALLAWSRSKPGWTGIWLGLGIAAKLYPVLLLVPLAVLCLRTRKLKEFALVVGAALAAWVAVNLPVYLAAPSGWLNFWTFNVDRGADLGSIWYVLQLAGLEVPRVSFVEAVFLVIGTLAISAVLMFAPRRPRLAQGVFLIVTLFLVVNKVYSPQYVLWLLPLLVLANPRWTDWTVFTLSELGYFAAIWGHLAGTLTSGAGGPDRLFWLAVVVRIGVHLFLCSRVMSDIFRPEDDPVRAGGFDEPDGGVFNDAPDVRWNSRPARQVLAG